MPIDTGTRRAGGLGFLGRIVIALAAAGLIPVALLSFRLIDLNRDALLLQVLQTHALSARTGADQVERVIAAHAMVIDSVVADREIEAAPASDAAKERVRSLLESRIDLEALAIDDPTGRELFRAQRKSASTEVAEILARRERPTVALDAGHGRMLLSITRPLLNQGRATAIFDAHAIPEALRASELGSEAARVLIDRGHRSVVGIETAAPHLPPALLRLASQGSISGSGRFAVPDGAEIVGAYAPVSGTPWSVISAQPATVAEQIAATLRRRSILAMIAALLLVAGLSLAGHYIVVRPINDLLSAQSEIGILTGDGSDVDRLRTSIAVLQKRVRDREALGRVFLGRFQVLETVGQGGMGTVFRGWDPKLQRPVALKTIIVAEAVSVEERRELISALMREAVTVAQFHHPDIVAVYDVEESPDAAFIAMEYVEGLSLESHLRAVQRLTVAETAVIGASIASALQAAHEARVIHRDVKPANVLLSWDGSIKVTDFGIAEFLNAMREDPWTVCGTPGYMAPEVIRGRNASPASDLFGLGVVLYRCVTGTPPFERGPVQTTLRATLSDAPRWPETVNTLLHPSLDTLIMKLLAKEPSDRGTAAEVVAVLRQLTEARRLSPDALAPGSPRIPRVEQDPQYVPTISLTT